MLPPNVIPHPRFDESELDEPVVKSVGVTIVQGEPILTVIETQGTRVLNRHFYPNKKTDLFKRLMAEALI